MQDGGDGLDTAVRVLTAIIRRQQPAPDDVEELRRLLPTMVDVPVDELAREVIQHAIHGH